jgi:predicted GNAT family acetyltransferase
VIVERDDSRSRYEGRVEGELVTMIDYERTGDVVDIVRTFTRTRWRGRGLAGEATAAALADIRAQGWRVHATCPFTVAFLDGHPEFQDLLVSPPAP